MMVNRGNRSVPLSLCRHSFPYHYYLIQVATGTPRYNSSSFPIFFCVVTYFSHVYNCVSRDGSYWDFPDVIRSDMIRLGVEGELNFCCFEITISMWHFITEYNQHE